VVAVPAHDEQDEIARCLEHVLVAAEHALGPGACDVVHVAVAAHRCVDSTMDVAAAVLGRSGHPWTVRRDEDSTTVGEVRRRLLEESLLLVGGAPRDTWIFNTDADSYVPRDWISTTLHQADHRHAHAVLGMVGLRGWQPSRETRERYAAIIADGLDEDGHRHVYGANFAVRLDAYLRAGGFRPVHAEDQDLADRLRADSESVISTFAPVVMTSARQPGRAPGGLGEMLLRLGDVVPAGETGHR
jgi:hypothetical protein